MKILLADDCDLYRSGTRAMLEAAYPGVQIIEARNYVAALDALAVYLDLDLIVYDVNIQGGRQFIGLGPLVGKAAGLPVVVLSTLDCDGRVEDILCTGASGYIAKNASEAQILTAIAQALSGGRPVLRQQRLEAMLL